jgi:hypothetical protein
MDTQESQVCRWEMGKVTPRPETRHRYHEALTRLAATPEAQRPTPQPRLSRPRADDSRRAWRSRQRTANPELGELRDLLAQLGLPYGCVQRLDRGQAGRMLAVVRAGLAAAEAARMANSPPASKKRGK